MSGTTNEPPAGQSIVLGDVTKSTFAIGAGAQVVYNNIQRALSEVERAEQAEEQARRAMGEAISGYVQALEQKAQSARAEPTRPREQTTRAREQITRAREQTTRGSPYKALFEYDIEDAAFFTAARPRSSTSWSGWTALR